MICAPCRTGGVIQDSAEHESGAIREAILYAARGEHGRCVANSRGLTPAEGRSWCDCHHAVPPPAVSVA